VFSPTSKRKLGKTHLEILVLSFRTTETAPSSVIVFLKCLVVFAVSVRVESFQDYQHCWVGMEGTTDRSARGKVFMHMENAF